MKREYPCLVSGLPELITDFDAKKIDFAALRNEIKESIHPSDYELVKALFYPYDNQNLLNTLLKKNIAFNNKGNFEQNTLAEKITNRCGLPKYMHDFIEIFENDKNEDYPDDILKLYERDRENLLQTLFYDETLKMKNRFIQQWFTFDRDLRNIQAAIIARRLQIDASAYFVGQHAEILAKSTAADFSLSSEIDWMHRIVQIAEIQDACERELKIDLFRWEKIDEFSVYNYFDIDAVLSFMQKADIAERWLSLDRQKGKEMFKKLIGDLMKTCDTQKVFNKKDIKNNEIKNQKI
ncbi:MAG: DUF2764 domain-containing protein [Prevotellaceae bacterium]|jgi:hypothetical protein|nr:DUF2764 domain-containing protein [Prevotellaceae bacterium]